MADKKVTLHPKNSSGEIQDNINIYPKTTIDQLYSEDGTTPFGNSSFQRPISVGSGLKLTGTQLDLDTSNTLKAILLDMIYPVNSIYMCTELASGHTECPIKEILGGEWERITEKFLYTAGDSHTAGTTGGYADCTVMDHKHLIFETSVVTSETGAHQHLIEMYFRVPEHGKYYMWDTAYASSRVEDQYYIQNNHSDEGVYQNLNQDTLTRANGEHTHVVTIPQHYTGDYGPTAAQRPETNYPPYLTVYAWKRVS